MNTTIDALPDVRDAFAGKRILLTGATGFVAKVLLEKLIRTVPDIGRIVLLIRAGGSGDARARFEREVAASSVFDHLRAVRPAWLERFLAERVECVTGEITAPDFGLAPARLVDWEDYLCRVHMAGLNRYALRRRDAVPEAPPETAAVDGGAETLAAPASH